MGVVWFYQETTRYRKKMFTKVSELICFAKFINGQNMSKISQRQTWGGTFLWRTDWNWNKWRWDHLCLQYLLSSLQSRITFCHMLLFYFHLYLFVFVYLNSYWIDNGCTDCKKWKWQWVKLKVATNRESCNKWKWEWQQKSENFVKVARCRSFNKSKWQHYEVLERVKS